ncbi:adenosylcobinamide-phosphate synthase CbiB [Desulfopila inferna]|uniref:adenosylcobinamide-phosphate synthase CbiB n=1 Tax=Desulfopila inferna TaxID=468528 RepID=UPI0019627BAE|nr:adenosylcobinamide-phosphate synthase CbiB [Desulfopila inferna]MBM9602852.1 cobalamin biosynthesis protein CobD [Desulfopila inferna]
MIFEILFIIALLLDGVLGDPRWYPHPVRIIAALAQSLEKVLRMIIADERSAGLAVTFLTLLVTLSTMTSLLYLAGVYSILLQAVFAVLIMYSLIAVKDLLVHSQAVYASLSPVENLEDARNAVGRIVGRDTEYLQNEEVCRACIETVAENMVDGITAPLFWAVVFSLFAAFTPLSEIAMAAIGMTMYKTINTMDSMFGYKNEVYLYFGWAPARLDDVANFIPARLSGLAVVLTSFLMGYDGKNSCRIFFRDRHNHSSPNAGHTEAALAGALGFQFGGPLSYFGEIVIKPFIGDDTERILPHHIIEANRIILTASFVCIFFLLLGRNICIWATMVL